MTVYNAGTLVADLVFLAVMVGIVVAIVFLVKARATHTEQLPVVPNWYPDPADAAQLRYFDGQSWTEDTRPRDAPPG
ncbi:MULTISPECIES: DUF2510 domain-containing protein [unclassified Mycobacterium]|uniref:DUF2510 domain-containing protein n=1 Tax=unclassified Mycobacterium TaxID=2642494 RepID=UPI00040E004E|nr:MULTISPECIES: DUF2510 domain-containing protein [unclassified Mycobacterium]